MFSVLFHLCQFTVFPKIFLFKLCTNDVIVELNDRTGSQTLLLYSGVTKLVREGPYCTER